MKLPPNKAIPPGGPYPKTPDNSELPGGHAGIRFREFNQGRLPEIDPPEEYDRSRFRSPGPDTEEPELDIIP
ncbi:MAG TPA: hypothetical protein VGE04_13115 [Chloroflexia bacterium]|jgi:hypothetical protein